MIIAYLFNHVPPDRPGRRCAARSSRWTSLGLEVDRYTVRATDEELVDPADIAERARARAVLGVGKLGLLRALAGNLLARPAAFLRALGQAVRMGRRSERGTLLHLIYLAEACVLRGWLVEAGTTHLHCHYGTNSAAVALLCRILGGPALQLHDARAGGVRLAPGPLAPRQDPPRGVRGGDQRVHPEPALPLGRPRRLAQDPGGPLRGRRDVPRGRADADPGRPPAGQRRPGGRAEGADAPDRGGGPADRRGGRLRGRDRRRRPDAGRGRAADRPARAPGQGPDRRLPEQPRRPPRDRGVAGPGPAELRRGAARRSSWRRSPWAGR